MSKFRASFPYDLNIHAGDGLGDIAIGGSAGTLCPSTQTTKELGNLLISENPAHDDNISDIAYGGISGYFDALNDIMDDYNRKVVDNPTVINSLLNDNTNYNIIKWLCILINIIVSSAHGCNVVVTEKTASCGTKSAPILAEWGKTLLGMPKLYSISIDGLEVAYLSKHFMFCPKNEIQSNNQQEPINLLGYNNNNGKFSVANLIGSLNNADKTIIKSYFNNFIVDATGTPIGHVYDGFDNCDHIIREIFINGVNPFTNGVQISQDIKPLPLSNVKGINFSILPNLGFFAEKDIFTDYILMYRSKDSQDICCTFPFKQTFDVNNITLINCVYGDRNSIIFTVTVNVMGINYEIYKIYEQNSIFTNNTMPFISVYPNLPQDVRPYYKKYQWTIRQSLQDIQMPDNDPNKIKMEFPQLKLSNQRHFNDILNDNNIGNFKYAFTESYLDFLFIQCNGLDVGCLCLKGDEGSEALKVGYNYQIPVDVPIATLDSTLNVGIDFGTGNTQVVVDTTHNGTVALDMDLQRHKLWYKYRVREITHIPEMEYAEFSMFSFAQSDSPETSFPTFIQEYSNIPEILSQQMNYAHYRIPFFDKSLTSSVMEVGFENFGLYSNLKFNMNGISPQIMESRIYRFLKAIANELVIRALEEHRKQVVIKASFPLESVLNILQSQWNNISADIQTNVINSQLLGNNNNFIKISDYLLESFALCNYIQNSFTVAGGDRAPVANILIVDLGQGTADLSFINYHMNMGQMENSLFGQTSVKFSGYKIIFDSINQFYKLMTKNSNADTTFFKDMWSCGVEPSAIKYRDDMVEKYISTVQNTNVAKNMTYNEKNNVISTLVNNCNFDKNKINTGGIYNKFISILEFKYLILFKTISAFAECIIASKETEETNVEIYLYGGASRALELIISNLRTNSPIQDMGFGKILATIVKRPVINTIFNSKNVEKVENLKNIAKMKKSRIQSLKLTYKTGANKFELAEGLLVIPEIGTSEFLAPSTGFKVPTSVGIIDGTIIDDNDDDDLFGSSFSIDDDDDMGMLDGFEEPIKNKKKVPIDTSTIDINEEKRPTLEGFLDYLYSLSNNINIEDGGNSVDIIQFIFNKLKCKNKQDIVNAIKPFFKEQKPYIDANMSEDTSYPAIKDKVFYMYLADKLFAKVIEN